MMQSDTLLLWFQPRRLLAKGRFLCKARPVWDPDRPFDLL